MHTPALQSRHKVIIGNEEIQYQSDSKAFFATPTTQGFPFLVFSPA